MKVVRLLSEEELENLQAFLRRTPILGFCANFDQASDGMASCNIS
jgi:hypothetical protein